MCLPFTRIYLNEKKYRYLHLYLNPHFIILIWSKTVKRKLWLFGAETLILTRPLFIYVWSWHLFWHMLLANTCHAKVYSVYPFLNFHLRMMYNHCFVQLNFTTWPLLQLVKFNCCKKCVGWTHKIPAHW